MQGKAAVQQRADAAVAKANQQVLAAQRQALKVREVLLCR